MNEIKSEKNDKVVVLSGKDKGKKARSWACPRRAARSSWKASTW